MADGVNAFDEQIERIKSNIANAYAVAGGKRATLPSETERNSNNLADTLATISPLLQDKEISPTEQDQIISYDSDYDGLNKVTVKKINLQSKKTTSNGLVVADDGYDGLKSVEIDVEIGSNIGDTTATAEDVKTGKYFYNASGVKTEGTIGTVIAGEITDNGTIETDGKYIEGNFKINVPSKTPNVIPKMITQNGTYVANDEAVDGYSEVVVNVETGVVPEGTLDITKNGTYDVRETAKVNVNVPSQIETTDEEILQAISNTNMVLGIEPVWTTEEINTMLTEYSSYRNLILGLGG